MNIAQLSIKRPIFIACVVFLILAIGYLSLKKLPIDLFPNVQFPIVTVNTVYPGAGPREVETSISKVVEEEISTLPGVKRVSSYSRDGFSSVFVEFALETDVKFAEQQVRDRVGSIGNKLPKDAKQPVIRRMDPADQPVLIVAIKSNLPEGKLYDLANLQIKTKLQQINNVGNVDILGGRKREIHVNLDRNKIKSHELSASRISNAIALSGQNIPAGTIRSTESEMAVRSVAEFKSIDDIGSTIINFLGNDVPIRLDEVATITDTLEDETSRAYVNGNKSIFLQVYRQSGSNTITVVESVKKQIKKLNSDLKTQQIDAEIIVVRDGSKMILANVIDVKESIIIGILLTIVVVYLFLGSVRSTIITSLALPNSLVGAFLLMSVAGYSINVMTLLALSLSVGLLIDDAIVVRENIFRHIEMGKAPLQAALDGTKEVMLAVIATTAAVLSVFGPIGFLQGVVGQFFKEFGLTICFAMCISLFDALTVAPMLSAYFAGSHDDRSTGVWNRTIGELARTFDRFQTWLETQYVSILRFTLRRPGTILLMALVIFLSSCVAVTKVPKTFLPPQDFGEFMVSLELPAGTGLDKTNEFAQSVDRAIRKNHEVAVTVLSVGNAQNEANVASIIVNLVPSKKRHINTSDFKDKLRGQLTRFSDGKPIVKDVDMVGGGQRPFNVVIIGNDLNELNAVGTRLFEKLKKHPGLLDVEMNYKPGKPEFQIQLDERKAARLGVSSVLAGAELRTLLEGSTPAVFRENGEEYTIRLRLQDDQRDFKTAFQSLYVPNINQTLIRLSDIATPVSTVAPSSINRQDRGRSIQISGDIAPKGPGMGGVKSDVERLCKSELNMPPGMGFAFIGQAESFQELGQNMMMAVILAVMFIFMVLASLYESVVTPFTIMLVLPLAACGAFYALLITGKSLDIFSMIGCIMLLGVATKNSILLVDYTNQQVEKGLDHASAILEAGKTRLRPILMTTIALIAGVAPIAIGLNEASRQRTSMGVAIIGGLISSTLLTLVVVPAAYSYIERFRVWSKGVLTRLFIAE